MKTGEGGVEFGDEDREKTGRYGRVSDIKVRSRRDNLSLFGVKISSDSRIESWSVILYVWYWSWEERRSEGDVPAMRRPWVFIWMGEVDGVDWSLPCSEGFKDAIRMLPIS